MARKNPLEVTPVQADWRKINVKEKVLSVRRESAGRLGEVCLPLGKMRPSLAETKWQWISAITGSMLPETEAFPHLL